MKGRQRQVWEAAAADRAPQLSFLPLISASGLLFVFTRQFGDVRGYHLCSGSKKKGKIDPHSKCTEEQWRLRQQQHRLSRETPDLRSDVLFEAEM